ncbi:hypothetical protein BVX98_01630 [bacterium F11]|nr:hypothetical protein BVX98_01630 [bacterium F11]
MKLIIIEIISYLWVPMWWYIFKRFAKRNIIGEIIAGIMIGVFLEFSTEPLWDYHFIITVYKGNTPLSVILGWGVMFAMVTFVSEKLYCWFFKQKQILAHDKRIFITDVIGGMLVGLPIEMSGLKLGVWNYRYEVLDWNWGFLPFFNMPYEALMAYALLMLVGPTFVRYWQGSFEKSKN